MLHADTSLIIAMIVYSVSIIGTDVVQIRIYAYECSIHTIRTLEYARRYFDLQIPKGMVRVQALCLHAYEEWRAHLNSLYISTLLKVKVSGSCIIVFLDAIVRISLPLESGSAVEDDYMKQRILFYRCLGKSYVQISCCLSEEGYATTKVGVYKFVKRYEERGIISHSPYDISYIVR